MVVSTISGFATTVVEGIAGHMSHLSIQEAIIMDMAVILIVSALLAFFAKLLRQPLIPAYVLAGIFIGPLALSFIHNSEWVYAFSEIGIAFLLFTAGLEISFRQIKEANLKKIALIGILQILAIVGITYLFAGILDLTTLQCAYIGIILAFGSTMVDVKLLADKGELVTLHGRLVLGILLLQDLVAIIAIVLFTTGGFAVAPLTAAFAKLIGMVIFAALLQILVLNRVFRFAARSTELLFLTSLATLFLFIILSYIADLSIVIGAFIAGVSLANSPFKTELESRVSPLRDFFAILFFVALGMQLVFSGVGEHVWLLVFLVAGAFIAKPLVTFILLRIFGYRPKTSFLTSISLAQLSEFSLIIGILGLSLGAFDASFLSTVILATIITMAVTPYFISFKDYIYQVVKSPLNALKFLPVSEVLEYKDDKPKEILMVGAHRMGGVLLKELLSKKDELLVVDYNPEIINALIRKKISCIYGDLCSPEILDKIDVKNLKLVISTVPGFEENLHLLTKVKKKNPHAKVVVVGNRISEALKLYHEGADFVVTPKVIAGRKLASIIHSKDFDLKKAKREHMKHLKEIHNILY